MFLFLFPDGIFRLTNVFDEQIQISDISQRLLRGTELGQESHKNIKLENYKIERYVAPSQSFLFSDSQTHLPEAYENEDIWVVESVVNYKSSRGHERSARFVHRFSKSMEPRLRWVEVLGLNLKKKFKKSK